MAREHKRGRWGKLLKRKTSSLPSSAVAGCDTEIKNFHFRFCCIHGGRRLNEVWWSPLVVQGTFILCFGDTVWLGLQGQNLPCCKARGEEINGVDPPAWSLAGEPWSVPWVYQVVRLQEPASKRPRSLFTSLKGGIWHTLGCDISPKLLRNIWWLWSRLDSSFAVQCLSRLFFFSSQKSYEIVHMY